VVIKQLHQSITRAIMLELKAFIGELLSINRFPSCAVLFGEIPPLEHEPFDDPMEGAAFVAEGEACGGPGT
jgi:hypothetical protein